MPWSSDMPTLLHDGEPKSPLFKWDVPEHYSTNAMRKKIMKKFVQTLQTEDYDWGGPYEDSVVIQAGFRVSFCLWLPEPGPVRRVTMKSFTAVIGDVIKDTDTIFLIIMKEATYFENKACYRKSIGYESPPRSLPSLKGTPYDDSTACGSSPSGTDSSPSRESRKYSPY